MIATFPMYDWPELRKAHNIFWQALRTSLIQQGLNAPDQLSRDSNDNQHWLSSDLLLGQTCGYPLATQLRNKVAYVATPVYSVKGCKGPYYSSAIIVNRHANFSLKSLRGTALAYNSTCSLSGYRALKAIMGDPKQYFGSLVLSGGHRNSAKMVAQGKADVAAIDAVCWHLIKRYDHKTAEQLSIIGWTEKYPALPLITSLKTSDHDLLCLRQSLQKVFNDPALQPISKELLIAGFKIMDPDKYLTLSSL